MSFLAPYYTVFRSGLTERELVTPPREYVVASHGTPIHLPASAALSGLFSDPDDESLKRVTVTRREFVFTFDPSPDEQPYADWIAREIEATFDCERMPPEVGTVLVPDVATNSRKLGDARLYDCLFSDTHPWVLPRAPEERAPAMEIDASRLTEKGTAVVTMLAALFQLLRTVMRLQERSCAVNVSIEIHGGLRKELLGVLAWIRQINESPVTPRDLAAISETEAAARELEALVTAWDGDGAPPDAMVAWASNFLAGWDARSTSAASAG